MNTLAYNSDGESVVCEKGELVCADPFPSMPIYFWNDADGKKYHKAYFEKFPGVWTHGDFIEITERGGILYMAEVIQFLTPVELELLLLKYIVLLKKCRRSGTV